VEMRVKKKELTNLNKIIDGNDSMSSAVNN
jgi:hypothetical protein